MFKKLICLSLLSFFSVLQAQEKKSLTHDDYDLWKNPVNPILSKDGNLVVTPVNTITKRGNGYLKIHNAKTGEEFTFHNGHSPKISSDGNFVFFLRKPDYETTRQEKKEEIKEEKQSKDDFFIYDVAKNMVTDSISRVKSFEAPKEYNSFVVLEKLKDLKPEKDSTKAKKETTVDSLKTEKPALEANYALVYNLTQKKADTIFRIKSYKLAEKQPRLYFTKTNGEKKPDIGIFEYDFEQEKEKVIDTGRFAYRKLAVNKTGDQLAFLSAKDSTEKDSLKFELFHLIDGQLDQVTDTLGKNLREGWELSSAQNPYFSETGKRLFFYSRPVRKFEMDTSLLEEEIPQVDVWNYRDRQIQPEQQARLKELEDQAYLSFLNTENEQIITLHDEELEFLMLDDKAEQQYILGYTSSPYDVSRSWEYPWRRDYYIVNTKTGEKTIALEGLTSSPFLSPDQQHAVYFNREDQNWWSLDLTTNEKRNLTEDQPVAFHDEENDVPADAGAYGFGGFTEDGKVFFFDQYDIWKANPAKASSAKNISKEGRNKNIEFRTLRLDRENRNLATTFNNRILIDAFDNTSKTGSLFLMNSRNGKMQPLLETEEMYLSGLVKAEDANVLLYRKENFRNFPDLYLWKSKKEPSVRITNANPQQEEFKWGTSEPFTWTAYDGTELDGIIYKPDNFNENKKYPMITYFYEKRSDNLNRYHSPQPSASIVNMSYLVSNDYVVFVPDIVYSH